jgi:hypothetical protein
MHTDYANDLYDLNKQRFVRHDKLQINAPCISPACAMHYCTVLISVQHAALETGAGGSAPSSAARAAVPGDGRRYAYDGDLPS